MDNSHHDVSASHAPPTQQRQIPASLINDEEFSQNGSFSFSPSNNSLLSRQSSIVNATPSQYNSLGQIVRPTLITGFNSATNINSGYNFSNHFINSPVETSILPGSFGKKVGNNDSNATPSSISKDIQRISPQKNNFNSLISPSGVNKIPNYRTQPNSFSESFVKENELNVPLINEPENQIPKKDLDDQSIYDTTSCSTLLERDFPAEILPFELLEKIDGNYIINNERVIGNNSSLNNNVNNYSYLYDHRQLFDDVLNPLDLDAGKNNRIIRVRTQHQINHYSSALDGIEDNENGDENGVDKNGSGSEGKDKPKRRPRTYSESETANFSTITGERLFDDDKHRPFASLHEHHEKLQDDSIHVSMVNSKQKSSANNSAAHSNIYLGLDSNLQTPNIDSPVDDGLVQIPVNITLHGGTIVPDEDYRPRFIGKRTNYNRNFGLAKTHQISTSTLELLNPGSSTKTGSKLHPNVEIYNNFESLLGCEDEYIPGLDFKTSISQWFDNDDDYNRIYDLQVIGSHVHSGDESDLAIIHSVESVKSDKQDRLTFDIPNHDDNPILTEAAHDYSFREVEGVKSSKSSTESSQYGNQSKFAIQSSKNKNLGNYKKNILNFNDYDYNNFSGGHTKLNQIPEFILINNKANSETKTQKINSTPPRTRDNTIIDSPKTLSTNAILRANEYNTSPIIPTNKHVSFEFGTVTENSSNSGASTSMSSSPLIISDLNKKLRQIRAEKLSLEIKKKLENLSEPTKEEIKEPPSKLSENHSEIYSPDTVKKVDYAELIDQLPDNFLELPFSKRRKLLLKILPPNDEHNQIDSKVLLQLIKARFSKKNSTKSELGKSTQSSAPVKPTSAASKFLSRVGKAPKKHNIDDRGSIVMHHELGKIIGYGSWGIVRECYSLAAEDNNKDGTRLVRAIKIVKTKNETVRKCFKKEIRIWRVLNHKRLLPLLFVKDTSYAIFCITPRIYGGTLFDIVSSWGFYNDPNSPIAISKRLVSVKKFIWEILDGLSYMHYNGIVHGDLKLENCLIDEIVNPFTKNIENHILICDFGMSQFYINPNISRQNSIASARSSLSKLNALNNSFTDLSESRPQIPRSSSSENLSVSFNKMRDILFNKAITHDDTPAGISTVYKQYGPAPASTTLNMTPISFNYIQNEQPSNDKTPLPHTHIGSLPYASPEILLPNAPPLGPTADIWAFGVLLYTMVVGKLPFQHNFEPRLRAMIAHGKFDTQCLQIAASTSPELIDIIIGCLTKDMVNRWDLNMIVDKLAK